MIRKKVCLLGAFSVGKTSLVRRYVHSIYSEEYMTTVGVKVDKKELELDGRALTLLIWDLHGEDAFQRVRDSYMRGTSGALLVADGTRTETLDTALTLYARLRDQCGDVPCELLVNKVDLEASWPVAPAEYAGIEELQNLQPRFTSALDGRGVEDAFGALARRLLR